MRQSAHIAAFSIRLRNSYLAAILQTYPMAKISTSIIAFNQADKIGEAVASVLWTDEIVLADSHSSDGTAEIAERLGARVVQIPITTFSELRNRAADACTHEWILSS